MKLLFPAVQLFGDPIQVVHNSGTLLHQKDIDNLEELWERITRLVRSHEKRLREWCLIRG